MSSKFDIGNSLTLFFIIMIALAGMFCIYMTVQEIKGEPARAIEAGCPAFTKEPHPALLGTRFELGGFATANRNVKIIDLGYQGMIRCSDCHIVEWSSSGKTF